MVIRQLGLIVRSIIYLLPHRRACESYPNVLDCFFLSCWHHLKGDIQSSEYVVGHIVITAESDGTSLPTAHGEGLHDEAHE